MQKDREYQLKIRGSVLSFRTGSFKAEMSSALHSGIYNREMVSSLAAGAVIVAVAIISVMKGIDLGVMHYVGTVIVFALLTFIFRIYIFFEEYLELTIDREHGVIEVIIRQMTKKNIKRSLSELTGVMKGLTLIAPDNPDGIEIVKNISLQHGMVIPGFGESKEYHSVNLEFGGLDTVSIFSTEELDEAEAVSQVINKFAGGGIAKTD
ncbi:hypothetical protein ACFL4R_00305 [Nitrospirota bacterium]